MSATPAQMKALIRERLKLGNNVIPDGSKRARTNVDHKSWGYTDSNKVRKLVGPGKGDKNWVEDSKDPHAPHVPLPELPEYPRQKRMCKRIEPVAMGGSPADDATDNQLAVLALAAENASNTSPRHVPQAPIVEAPIVEAPIVEAPIVEAPIVEAPVVAPIEQGSPPPPPKSRALELSQEECRLWREEARALAKKGEELEKKAKEVEKKLENAQQEVEFYKTACQKLQGELQKARDETGKVHDTMNARVVNLEKELVEARGRIPEIHNTLTQEMGFQSDSNNRVIEGLREQLAEATEANGILKRTLSVMDNDVQEANSKRQKTDEELAELYVKHTGLVLDKTHLEKAIVDLKAKYEQDIKASQDATEAARLERAAAMFELWALKVQFGLPLN